MKIGYVAAVGALMLTVAACDASAPAQKSVTGLRDDVKHIKAVTKRVQEQKYKRVCTNTVKGVCKKYEKVKDGLPRTVTKEVAPEAWCVELDDVNGSTSDDDVWYATSHAVYLKALGKDEGEKLKFKPLHGGCW